MSDLYIPSFSESLAVAQTRGADSEAPELWDGLVAGYPFLQGGGAELFDISGRGNHGTLTNMDPATDWVTTGQRGIPWALDCDYEQSQYVNVPSFAVSPWKGDCTVNIWIRPTTSAVSRPILGQGSTAKVKWMYIVINVDNTIHFSFDDDISARLEWDTTLTAPDNVWSLISVTKSATGFVSYVNAVPSGSGAARGDCGSTEDLTIGYDQYAGTSHYWWGGIGPVTLHSGVLVPSKIQTLYERPLAIVTRRPTILPAAVAPGGGHPTMRRWGGIPHMTPGPVLAGRSW